MSLLIDTFHVLLSSEQKLLFVFHSSSKWFAANLVEPNATPNGYALVNPDYVRKHSAFDLISLATEIQNADVALNQHSGKLSLILDQVKLNILNTIFSLW